MKIFPAAVDGGGGGGGVTGVSSVKPRERSLSAIR